MFSKIGVRVLILLGVILIIGGCGTKDLLPRSQPLVAIDQPVEFDGVLVAVSDVDMKAEAYVNGRVFPAENQVDSLTLFDFSDGRLSKGEVEASNSVMGWPQIVEVSNDKRFAYVVEVRGKFPAGEQTFDDLFNESPAGEWLSVFDISDPSAPALVTKTSIGVNPSSISLDPSGRWLLSSSEVAGEEIVLVELKDGLPVDKLSFTYPYEVPDVGAKGTGIRALSWHPSGDYLAANISDHQVTFMKLVYDSAGTPIAVERFGNPINDFLEESSTALSAGVFSNSGRHFLVPDIGWGHQTPRAFLFSPRGSMVSIAFDSENAEHHVVDVEQVGWSPEGMALSHDNSLIVTVNMERTSAAGTFPAGLVARRDGASSLSLLTFDSETGQMTKVDEKAFRGILPEDAVFDLDDDTLAVTIYHYLEFEPESGFIEFWDIDRSGSTPQLVKTHRAVRTPRGVHDLDVY